MKKMKSKQVICSTRKVETDCLQHLAEEIRALSTISQQLAEAFRKNSALAPCPITFLTLPRCSLKNPLTLSLNPSCGTTLSSLCPSGCKVYPLSPLEQKELDAFLKDNLES
jgi:hypothetical protein